MKPIQPLYQDDNGTTRFQGNAVVRYLLDNGSLDLNKLAIAAIEENFPQEDQEQFAQLIGYSLGGFSELSYVSDECYEAAAIMADQGIDQKSANIKALSEMIDKVREGLKIATPAVFRIHPDDLSK